jgi:Ca2+-binding RTX toxin-like protein
LKNVVADHMTGDNVLDGSSPWDPGKAWVLGTADHDVMAGSATQDLIDAGDGNDRIAGLDGNDNLHGAAGDDRIDGSTGKDTIAGGLGSDRMTGGDGSDTFLFYTTADSAPGAADLIRDLAADDTIDLSLIDADSTVFGDQAFTIVMSFTSAAGEATLVFDHGTRTTVLSLDTDGDGVADGVIAIKGNVTGFADIAL